MRSVDIPVKQADLVDTLSSMRAWLDQAIKHPALRSVSSRIAWPVAPLRSSRVKGVTEQWLCAGSTRRFAPI